jgi:hypothetical protein
MAQLVVTPTQTSPRLLQACKGYYFAVARLWSNKAQNSSLSLVQYEMSLKCAGVSNMK